MLTNTSQYLETAASSIYLNSMRQHISILADKCSGGRCGRFSLQLVPSAKNDV